MELEYKLNDGRIFDKPIKGRFEKGDQVEVGDEVGKILKANGFFKELREKKVKEEVKEEVIKDDNL